MHVKTMRSLVALILLATALFTANISPVPAVHNGEPLSYAGCNVPKCKQF